MRWIELVGPFVIVCGLAACGSSGGSGTGAGGSGATGGSSTGGSGGADSGAGGNGAAGSAGNSAGGNSAGGGSNGDAGCVSQLNGPCGGNTAHPCVCGAGLVCKLNSIPDTGGTCQMQP